MQLLLLSNSTNYGETFLEYCKAGIRDFVAGHNSKIVFIPYASVTLKWDEYEYKVIDTLSAVNLSVKSLHFFENPVSTLEKASCIMVGGGNTFQLLTYLYNLNLIHSIRDLVKNGFPYVGWNAGANLACPIIQTTNDMPIIFPHSLNSLDLIPFQINPHFTEDIILNHAGESRQARLCEFVEVNRSTLVLGLPEGMMLEVREGIFNLIGHKGVKTFYFKRESEWIFDNFKLNELLKKYYEDTDRT